MRKIIGVNLEYDGTLMLDFDDSDYIYFPIHVSDSRMLPQFEKLFIGKRCTDSGVVIFEKDGRDSP